MTVVTTLAPQGFRRHDFALVTDFCTVTVARAVRGSRLTRVIDSKGEAQVPRHESKVIGTLAVHNGKVEATGLGNMAAELMVLEPGTLVRLSPADGNRWLRALRYEFRTAYVRAVVVRDDDA